MVFQQNASDDSLEMTRLCLGLLIKCSHHPNTDVVAMATAKLHALLQSRATQDPHELGYLFYRINKALDSAIEGISFLQLKNINCSSKALPSFRILTVGHSEQYAFLMPVLKALLEKSRLILSLTTNVPDLPPTSSGPVFFNDFQMYSTSKQWMTFIENKVSKLSGILIVPTGNLFVKRKVSKK